MRMVTPYRINGNSIQPFMIYDFKVQMSVTPNISGSARVSYIRKMLVIVYNLLKNSDVYNEGKFEVARQKQETMRLHKLATEAKKLGFSLVQSDRAA